MGHFAVEGQRAQVRHPHRVENPVEMVDLVLQDAGEQAGGQTGDRAPVTVQGAVAQVGMARDATAQARDRQAALEGELVRRADRLELRIDQDMRDRAGALGPVGQVERHDDAQRFVDLRRREADPLGIDHGRQHVVDQPLDLGGGGIGHGLGPGQEDRLAEQGDLAQGHGRQIAPPRAGEQVWLGGARGSCYQPANPSNEGRALFAPIPSGSGVGPIVEVQVRDNNVDQALRALKKKMQREGIFREMKLRGAYEKPSEKRARERAEAVRRYRKLQRKRLQREGLLPR